VAQRAAAQKRTNNSRICDVRGVVKLLSGKCPIMLRRYWRMEWAEGSGGGGLPQHAGGEEEQEWKVGDMRIWFLATVGIGLQLCCTKQHMCQTCVGVQWRKRPNASAEECLFTGMSSVAEVDSEVRAGQQVLIHNDGP
jgi:hypothetical protein